MEHGLKKRPANGPAPHWGIGWRRCLCGLGVLLLLVTPLHACWAEFTARDAQIIARALSFIEPGGTGALEIGIAYAPDRPDSVRQAEELQAAIGDALVAGKITLKSRLIPIDQLPAATGIGAIFVTSDLGSRLDDAAAAARRLHVPTISTELACVRTARCVLAFSSQPTVEITLNHDAANNAGVHFTQAFRMLVREL